MKGTNKFYSTISKLTIQADARAYVKLSDITRGRLGAIIELVSIELLTNDAASTLGRRRAKWNRRYPEIDR